MAPHDRRRFVENLDFVTTPGYLAGKGAREKAGLPPGTGPYKVITNLAVLGYDDDTCRMCVESLHPGVDLEEVKQNTGFEIPANSRVDVTSPPTREELRIIREQVDPYGYLIGRDPS